MKHLKELFDNPADWKYTHMYGQMIRAEFLIDNQLYVMSLDYAENNNLFPGFPDIMWELVFLRGDETGIQGTGSQFTVFSTVADFLMDAVDKCQIDCVAFSAKEPSRVRLYTVFARKLEKDLGWKCLIDDSQVETYFIFKR